ncbi:hypothetical protein [Streptomyces kebangsaanensis]|uniref:hypothetical protein n=1 Tax=Streptomyces kebangsaanensis TaxID=864058 RepID=UPI000AB64883|nr:hypothetical protein [Streptomyces kebangsaanensis]
MARTTTRRAAALLVLLPVAGGLLTGCGRTDKAADTPTGTGTRATASAAAGSPSSAPATRDRTKSDDSQADGLRVNSGPYGPDTCKPGYVWREAVPGDRVCVTPATRDRARYDNSQAANRRLGYGAYGPDTCKQGYVWREAVPSDRVCVTPATRAQVKEDNAFAGGRRASACIFNDGVTYDKKYVAVGSNPTRYRYFRSPYLGARWDECAHTVTLYIGGDATATHYNLRVDKRQRELTGTDGPRRYTMKDSEFTGGTHDLVIQSCKRGGLFQSSTCTNWSPTVRLAVHVGTNAQ